MSESVSSIRMTALRSSMKPYQFYVYFRFHALHVIVDVMVLSLFLNAIYCDIKNCH